MELRKLNRGQNLTQDELKEIANNFKLGYHAQERIKERHPNLNIKDVILNPILAYYNTDRTVNIAMNKYEYLVISTDYRPYKVITFKEKSLNSITIYEKQKMACNGYNRKI